MDKIKILVDKEMSINGCVARLTINERVNKAIETNWKEFNLFEKGMFLADLELEGKLFAIECEEYGFKVSCNNTYEEDEFDMDDSGHLYPRTFLNEIGIIDFKDCPATVEEVEKDFIEKVELFFTLS